MKGLRFSAGLLFGPLASSRTSLAIFHAPSPIIATTIPAPPRPTIQHQQLRFRHVEFPERMEQVPAPTPFVPDVPTFLQLIGRNMKRFAEKIPTWEALFTLTSAELKELGVNPSRDRKYLLHWLQKFRNRMYGPGGDLAYVRDGVAALRVGRDIKTGKSWVVNVPLEEGVDVTAPSPGKPSRDLYEFLEQTDPEAHVIPRLYKIHGADTIGGPFARINNKDIGGATVTRREGMWEETRGKKLDGGERRMNEVRFKRRVAVARAAREARLAKEMGI